ncbi:MAG TPA: histidine kinase dimerization/phospho-acceptor domain-containing protein, partial [Dongiaceae bacterium]|nr:histidine kinase dimerization/phospho-acceptor domain-containing protein [Dongiaceae bacterium]
MSAAPGLDRRDRLVILGVALIGLVALLTGWLMAEWRVRDAVRSYALSVAERVTQAAADILDPNGPETVYANDREAHAVALQLLQRTSGVLRMVAFNRNSIVWLDSTGAAVGRHYDQEDVAEVFATGEPLVMMHMAGGDYHVLGLDEGASALAESYVPIRRNGDIVGAFELYIDATDILAAATRIARIAYAVFVVTILVAMAAILLLVWRSLHRRRRDLLAIDALRRNAEAISAELTAANKRQERFNANAAHELRTPLAILRARLDAMKEDDDLRALRRDVDSMIHQVELLLELARTETMTMGAEARIDLAELAQNMAARLYPVARRAGRDIAVESPSRSVVVTGDPALMESALRNLLENALRASPPGAT